MNKTSLLKPVRENHGGPLSFSLHPLLSIMSTPKGVNHVLWENIKEHLLANAHNLTPENAKSLLDKLDATKKTLKGKEQQEMTALINAVRQPITRMAQWNQQSQKLNGDELVNQLRVAHSQQNAHWQRMKHASNQANKQQHAMHGLNENLHIETLLNAVLQWKNVADLRPADRLLVQELGHGGYTQLK